jgi:arylamine N-acetyltransferase
MGSNTDLSLRPTYLPEQLNRYFHKINIPSHLRAELRAINGDASTNNVVALSLLEALQWYQLASVPFENLDLHYLVYRSISADPQSLFEKLLDSQSHRGGYCMENNTLFVLAKYRYKNSI